MAVSSPLSNRKKYKLRGRHLSFDGEIGTQDGTNVATPSTSTSTGGNKDKGKY